MALPSLCPEFETNLMSNRKFIQLVLQLKSARARGINYIKVEPQMVRHLLRNRLLTQMSLRHKMSTKIVLLMRQVFKGSPMQKALVPNLFRLKSSK